MEDGNQNPPVPQPIAQATESEKWHQHKGIRTSIILAVIAGIFIWVYFILNQPKDLGPIVVNHKTSSNIQPTVTSATTVESNIATSTVPNSVSPSSTDETLVSTQGWLEYHNGQWGLDFKYPPDWHTTDFSNASTWNVNVDAPGNSAAIQFATFGSSIGALYNHGSPKVTNITLGTAKALMYTFPDGLQSIQIVSALPKWSQSGNRIDLFPLGQTAAQQKINTILSTVNFFPPDLDPTTNTWATYDTYGSNNGVSYKFQYPPDWSQENVGFFADQASASLSINTPATDPNSFGAISSSAALTVDGQAATELVFGSRTDAKYLVVTFDDPVLHSNLDIAMDYPFGNNDHYTALFKQILSTFHFNRISLDTSTWQALDNLDMGIELQVPSGWSAAQLTASTTFITNAAQAQNMTIPGADDSFVIVTKSQQCAQTNSFQTSDYGSSALIEIACKAGLKFTLGVWKQSYDKDNITQALQKIPGTLTTIQAGSLDQGGY
jgi:hypothetical protein